MWTVSQPYIVAELTVEIAPFGYLKGKPQGIQIPGSIS